MGTTTPYSAAARLNRAAREAEAVSGAEEAAAAAEAVSEAEDCSGAAAGVETGSLEDPSLGRLENARRVDGVPSRRDRKGVVDVKSGVVCENCGVNVESGVVDA